MASCTYRRCISSNSPRRDENTRRCPLPCWTTRRCIPRRSGGVGPVFGSRLTWSCSLERLGTLMYVLLVEFSLGLGTSARRIIPYADCWSIDNVKAIANRSRCYRGPAFLGLRNGRDTFGMRSLACPESGKEFGATRRKISTPHPLDLTSRSVRRFRPSEVMGYLHHHHVVAALRKRLKAFLGSARIKIMQWH